MAEILHQLRLVLYPIIDRVLYIPGGTGFLPSTVGVPISKDKFIQNGSANPETSESPHTKSLAVKKRLVVKHLSVYIFFLLENWEKMENGIACK